MKIVKVDISKVENRRKQTRFTNESLWLKGNKLKKTIKLKKEICYWIFYCYGFRIQKKWVQGFLISIKWASKRHYDFYKKLKENIHELTHKMNFKREQIPEIIRHYHMTHSKCLRLKDDTFFTFLLYDLVEYSYQFMKKKKPKIKQEYDEFQRTKQKVIDKFFEEIKR